MDYEVIVSEAERIIRVIVYKTITAEIEYGFSTDMINAANEHKLLHFLFDVTRVHNETSPSDHYEIVHRQLTPTPLDHRAKFAIVISAGDDSYDFTRTAMLNAGYLCELFTDKDAALAWLDP